MEPEKKELSPEDKKNYARDMKSDMHARILLSEQRSAAVSDEFIRLEVQIATILFAFASLFLAKLNPSLVIIPNNVVEVPILMKLSFVFSIFCLMISLACGLLHLKTQESFSDGLLRQRIIRFNKWCQVNSGGTSFEQAQAYHDGTGMELGQTRTAPSWAWILQTICLGLGIVTLFTLMIVYLFR
jgi:hypothetical protein